MRRLVNTSISSFFGLMMLQTFGAGCTALVEVGDDSDDGVGQEAGPGDDAHGTGSVGAGGNSSTGGGSSVGSGGDSSTGGASSVGSGGDSSTGGASSVGAGGSASTGSGSGPATAGAIAFFRNESPGESGTGSSAGPGTSPNDLFIVFGSPVSRCSDPSGTTGCGNWQWSISIPPALQVPGIIDLSAPEVLFSYYTVSRPDRGGCWWGDGSFRSGTMEIVSIDAAEVVIRLSGTDTHDFDANGEYTAARCP
ncbi:hypothetical protein predicted by Glimmer/Critica [Sorangium cellulosum So ce56]|uniref:Secreted protein n=1 Tax=Sorangium cellulosum (strain So ce56) TaxID=448385 RepID=A9GPZ8_SORC5|nr:hypothetical protein [Sorangium cellulosum]CAN96826.1 hypothetical protein predicted by Glimmer/Critica [Sorangium cellulosum So ce56]